MKFELENNQIPVEYRRCILSFFKKSLSEIENQKYYHKYYFNKSRRPFTFAVGLPNPVFSEKSIKLSNNEMTLTFSTGDELTGYVFYSAFIAMKQKKFSLKNNSLKLVSIRKIYDPSVISDSALVRMMSPLCLRKHVENGDMYVSVSSDLFENDAKEIIECQLLSEGFNEELSKSFCIIPVNTKKTVVQHYNSFIECSLGDFAIKGDKAVINYLLKNGMGSRKSAGFGCIKLISE